MLEEMSDRLLCDLRDVMVERTNLTMGQKLGKGVNKLSPSACFWVLQTSLLRYKNIRLKRLKCIHYYLSESFMISEGSCDTEDWSNDDATRPSHE